MPRNDFGIGARQHADHKDAAPLGYNVHGQPLRSQVSLSLSTALNTRTMSSDAHTSSTGTETRRIGKCLCGQVSYELAGQPTFIALCHCVNCKKWTGAESGWFIFFNKEVCATCILYEPDLLLTFAASSSIPLFSKSVSPAAKAPSALTQTMRHSAGRLSCGTFALRAEAT